MNLNDMVELEIKNGYGDASAQSKVCQDIILKAISDSDLAGNITIKGGVVLRSKSGDVRRATQDLDLDFIRYSLEDKSIDRFIIKLNCIKGITIRRIGEIEELKQQDYHGKRVFVQISDNYGNEIGSKLDLGVHTHLDIKQEEYCFDIAFDESGANVLINTNEQMFTEKLRSLLRFGPNSTRYKDIYDMFFLSKKIDYMKMAGCIKEYIIDDLEMRENSIEDILKRLKRAFNDENYMKKAEMTKSKWMEEDVGTVTNGIMECLTNLLKDEISMV